MNKVVLMGRLTRDPEVRYTQGEMAIGRYTLAVDRRFKKRWRSRGRLYQLRSLWKTGRICRKILPSGLESYHFRPDPDWKLHEPGGKKMYTPQMLW